MKHKNLFVTFLPLTAFAVGCKPAEEKSTSGQIERLTQQTKDVSQDMKDFTFAQKAEFVAKMQSQLDALYNQDRS